MFKVGDWVWFEKGHPIRLSLRSIAKGRIVSITTFGYIDISIKYPHQTISYQERVWRGSILGYV